MKIPGVFLLLFLLAMVSCNNNSIYEKNVDIPDKSWPVAFTPTFRFEIQNPEKPYNIYWNIRNTAAYPYRNLYVTYYLEDTLGNLISKDLHNMLLFDPKTGKPYGSGAGDIYSHQNLALPNYQFDSAGTYQVRLAQYMRKDTLSEIISVGVRVASSDK